MTSTTIGAAGETRLPRKGGDRRVCPAVGFCGSPGLSDSGLQPVPWFHENTHLPVDGRGVADANAGAGRAAGETRGSSGRLMTSPTALKCVQTRE
jgi:hypothetical protein